jgi:hypothetical protein
MHILIYLCLATYFSFYLFEGPIRYGLNAIGADYLIFIRDLLLVLALSVGIIIRQRLKQKLHPAFYIFAIIILIHGFISLVNIGSAFVIFYCIKLLFTALAGAVLAPYLMNPPKQVVLVVLALFIITFIGVLIDKYDFIEYPWTGLKATMGEIQVDISRDWDISGADKRAGGLMRSSINVAIVTPLLAFILLFNIRSLLGRIIIMLVTVMILYCSTQKASILAFAFVCGLLLAFHKRPIPALKIGISFAFVLMVVLPILLPQFIMPNDQGVFSLKSFYMRVEDVWPKAWLWIERKEVFPFGIGLGGIGGAQRFYSEEYFSPADNMFIFLYAYFGLLSFVYMGWLWWRCMRVSDKQSSSTIHALSIVMFITFYGIAMSMIEDQMVTLFLGAATAWIASNHVKNELKNKPV